MSGRAAVWLALFVLGAGLRLVGVERPAERPEIWREFDLAGITRNFVREGMNPWYPRVDWRGDGPGFVEMELPLHPWTAAVLVRVAGLDEVRAGRAIAFVLSLAGLVAFFRLSRRLLPEAGALAASLFLAVNPLAVRVSHLLLADGAMFCLTLIAVAAFVRWMGVGPERSGPAEELRVTADFPIALAATALAVLAKSPALHLGLLFGALSLRRFGRRAVGQPLLWAFALVTLLLSAGWYAHAYRLWLDYGNSLGLSNEHHWMGVDTLADPRYARGIAALEWTWVWTPFGLLVAAIGIASSPARRAVELGLWWWGALAVFYVVAARTTSAPWGVYYHVVAVAPAALLFGAGAEVVLSHGPPVLRRLASTTLAALGTAMIAVWLVRPLHPALGVLGVVSSLAGGALWIGGGPRARLTRSALLFAGVLASCGALLWALRLDYSHAVDRDEDPLHACARRFAAVLPPDGLLIASGGRCRDHAGRSVAGNKPYMFYWLDRRGFNLCEERQSLEEVDALIRRGARQLVAEKSALVLAPGFEDRLRRRFPVLAECDRALLLDLRAPASVSSR
jgi:4-amino-4-deoxy-L-arabinose transferase-like glycosyltransferase